MPKAVLNGVLPGILDRIGELRLYGRIPVVVFDLDDTLFSRKNRHIRILAEFAMSPSVNPNMRKAAKMLIDQGEGDNWSIAHAAAACGVDAMAMRHAMHHFWTDRFHHHHYVTDDAPVPGAPDYIRALLCARAIVVYVTRREEARRKETLETLHNDEFPLPGEMPWNDRVRLIMKQNHDESELAFKLGALGGIVHEGAHLVAVFENRTHYLVEMFRKYPAMTPIQLGRDQHKGPALPPGIVAIPHFLPKE